MCTRRSIQPSESILGCIHRFGRRRLLLLLLLLTALLQTRPATADILVSETGANRILRFQEGSGAFLGVFATGLNYPEGLAIASDGTVYVAEFFTAQVKRFRPDGAFDGVFCTLPQEWFSPTRGNSVALDPDGTVLVAHTFGITRYHSDGSLIGHVVQGPALVNGQVILDSARRIYFTSGMEPAVIRVNPDGSGWTEIGRTTGFGFYGLAFGPDDKLYISKLGAGTIYRWDEANGLQPYVTTPVGVLGASNFAGIAFDSNGDLLIGLATGPSPDLGVYRVTPDGVWSFIATDLSYPQFIAVPKTNAPNDTVVPVTSSSANPAPNADGWNNTDVTVTMTASDNDGGSGVAETYYRIGEGDPMPYSGPLGFSGEGTFVLRAWSVDSAGNVEAERLVATIRIDKTSPEVAFGAQSPPANAAGWSNGAVIVPVIASDNLSGIDSIDPGGQITFSAEGFGQTQPVTVTDAAGNSVTVNSPAVNIDLTPPAFTLPIPPVSATATSPQGAVVSFAVPSAADALSGVAQTTCSSASGSLFPLGESTVTCVSKDAAGNSASTSFTVHVSYSWSGILQPVNADGSSVFKLGRPVPLKFALTGASAGITDATARLYVARISDGVAGTEEEADSQAQATEGNLFRYDPESGQYVFNMRTRDFSVGTYRLRIDLSDGIERTVIVSLR